MNESDYSETLTLEDMDKVQALAVKVIMQSGALVYQKAALEALKKKKMKKAAKLLLELEVNFDE